MRPMGPSEADGAPAPDGSRRDAPFGGRGRLLVGSRETLPAGQLRVRLEDSWGPCATDAAAMLVHGRGDEQAGIAGAAASASPWSPSSAPAASAATCVSEVAAGGGAWRATAAGGGAAALGAAAASSSDLSPLRGVLGD